MVIKLSGLPYISALIFYNSCRGPTGLDGCLGFLDLFHQFPSHIHTFKALDSHGYPRCKEQLDLFLWSRYLHFAFGWDGAMMSLKQE
ncbi:hypothetical protein POPTR_003G087550v4 [Populus trichocarpa]|uniref:Uncharacterized protein n=1 Tax=Populus trichocarpa TaxID=3694 RepID=A0ACC0T8L6_POPTR|nr:hypothetical protein BDE02_03G077600 [Populus trichocarpa]KAI9397835.1 hypothetical protein POPTR_003G087550v4 [Populus trichocarpa]